MKKVFLVVLNCILVLLFINIEGSSAHPGNTDRSGCHTCKTNCSSWGLSYGEYHCHNGSTSSYTTSYTSTPTYESCSTTYGWASQDTGNGKCGCMSGYEFGTDILGKTTCVAKKTCSDLYGWNATDNYDGTCSCRSGYEFGTNYLGKKTCVAKKTCSDLYGWNSIDNNNGTCSCSSGYEFGIDYLGNKSCVVAKTCADIYGYNAQDNSDGKTCSCKTGYKWSTDGKNCELKVVLSEADMCRASFGINSVSVGNNKCNCKSGYQWSTDGKSCELKIVAPVKKIKCTTGQLIRAGKCVDKKSLK